ncbi:MAG: ceramidase domain-containing protein, partial [Methyloligellaceae bacterium]
MAIQDRIFSYCERGQDPALWAEPLNAASNLAFVVAAIAASVMLFRQPSASRSGDHFLLVFLVFAIGVGSFLFHVFANRWSVMADVIPITLFILVYFAFALNRYVGVPVGWTVVLTAAYMSVAQGVSTLKCRPGLAGDVIGFGAGSGQTCLNGSIGYVPALIALLLVGGILFVRRHAAASTLLLAGCVLAVSLIFR